MARQLPDVPCPDSSHHRIDAQMRRREMVLIATSIQFRIVLEHLKRKEVKSPGAGGQEPRRVGTYYGRRFPMHLVVFSFCEPKKKMKLLKCCRDATRALQPGGSGNAGPGRWNRMEIEMDMPRHKPGRRRIFPPSRRPNSIPGPRCPCSAPLPVRPNLINLPMSSSCSSCCTCSEEYLPCV